MRPATAALLLAATALTLLPTRSRAELLGIELAPEQWTSSAASILGWSFVRDLHHPGVFAIRVRAMVADAGERNWDYQLPQDQVELVPRAGGALLVLVTPANGRRYLLAKDSPFAPPENFMIRAQGIDLAVVQAFSRLVLTLDPAKNPPIQSAHEGAALANFGALFGPAD